MSKRNDEIVTRYIDDGFSLQDVGKEFGITRERVRQILAHAGITERHQGIHNKLERKSTTQDAYARITEGLITVVEEAERIGIKTTSLYARFHRYQLPSLKKEAEHGTCYYYRNYRCRCDNCRAAIRAYSQKLKTKEAPHHGTLSGYHNYGCRCDVCRA